MPNMGSLANQALQAYHMQTPEAINITIQKGLIVQQNVRSPFPCFVMDLEFDITSKGDRYQYLMLIIFHFTG